MHPYSFETTNLITHVTRARPSSHFDLGLAAALIQKPFCHKDPGLDCFHQDFLCLRPPTFVTIPDYKGKLCSAPSPQLNSLIV